MKFQEAYLIIFSILLPSPLLLVGAGTITTPTATRQLSRALQSMVVDLLPTARDAIRLNDGTSVGRGVAMMEALEGSDEEQMLELPLFHGRKLQLTGTCNTTFVEFWEDQALYDAFIFFWDNRMESIETLAANVDENCAENDVGGILCDLDVPINGATEFKSACATAGGRLVTFSLDVSCTLIGEGGETTDVVYDDPVDLDCIPGTSSFDSCHDEIIAMFSAFAHEEAALTESALSEANPLTDVSCKPVGGDNGVVIEENGGSGEDEVVVDTDGSTTTKEEDEVEVENNNGPSKAFTRGTCWFPSVVIIMVSRFGLVTDTTS